MSAPLLQFRDGADGVRVDLATLIATRLVIQGSSGAGKSYLLRWMLEQTHGQIQHLVIDPEGEFATLRERFDYIVASAGDDGDVPADPHTAKLLARQLVELGASAILDLYELDPDDRSLFVSRFLKELITLPKDMWRPLLVVVDEAHEYAPQVAGDGPASLGPMRLLASKGRKRGFGAVFATQRISKLHKDAADAGNFLIGYTGLDVDVLRAGDMLGMDKPSRQALKRLDPGQFYAFGPAISRDVQLVRSGTVETTHPKAGDVAPPTPPAPAKIQALLAQLHDIPERAAEEEAEMERLRHENARLQRELRAAQKGQPAAAAPDPAGVQKAVERAVTERDRAHARELAAVRKAVDEHNRSLARYGPAFHRAVQGVIDLAKAFPEPLALPDSAGKDPAAMPRTAKSTPATAPLPRVIEQVAGDGSVSAPQARILATLASFEAIGVVQVDRSVVAVMSDQSPRSSGYANNLGHLRNQLGLIDYPAGGAVSLTDAGRAVAPHVDPPGSLGELWAAWKSKLSEPQGRILDALVEAYPESIGRAALAEATGQSATSSGYANNLGSMRTLGIVDYPSRGEVAATRLLFPEGLR